MNTSAVTLNTFPRAVKSRRGGHLREVTVSHEPERGRPKQGQEVLGIKEISLPKTGRTAFFRGNMSP